MTRPLIQIGNEVREMTEEEHAEYLLARQGALEPTDETITRELTAEEVAALPEPTEPLAE